MGYWHNGDRFGSWGWIGIIVMILFWLVMLALFVWAITSIMSSTSRRSNSGPGTPPEDSAMRILRERYARGEIDSEQFEQARRTLNNDGRSPA